MTAQIFPFPADPGQQAVGRQRSRVTLAFFNNATPIDPTYLLAHGNSVEVRAIHIRSCLGAYSNLTEWAAGQWRSTSRVTSQVTRSSRPQRTVFKVGHEIERGTA